MYRLGQNIAVMAYVINLTTLAIFINMLYKFSLTFIRKLGMHLAKKVDKIQISGYFHKWVKWIFYRWLLKTEQMK